MTKYRTQIQRPKPIPWKKVNYLLKQPKPQTQIQYQITEPDVLQRNSNSEDM